MARIRTVKPEFFRHEGLQDLERANPGAYVMLVFEGLWTQCDRAGRFEWRPRLLKLDILPFLDFDMATTLGILESAGYLVRYVVDGKEYGQVPTFETHQRFSGKEASEQGKHPAPPVKREGSNGEATGKQLRTQEREKEREGNGEEQSAPPAGGAPARSDPIPYEAIVDTFNRTMERLPKVREITPKRRTLIRSAWQASPQRRSIEFWNAYFAECADNSFHNGTGPYRPPHENWRPDFDFLLRADIVTKVFEKAIDRLERGE